VQPAHAEEVHGRRGASPTTSAGGPPPSGVGLLHVVRDAERSQGGDHGRLAAFRHESLAGVVERVERWICLAGLLGSRWAARRRVAMASSRRKRRPSGLLRIPRESARLCAPASLIGQEPSEAGGRHAKGGECRRATSGGARGWAPGASSLARGNALLPIACRAPCGPATKGAQAPLCASFAEHRFLSFDD